MSGAPIVTKFHAVYIADMGLEMMDVMKELPDPSRKGEHLKIRMGNLSPYNSFLRSWDNLHVLHNYVTDFSEWHICRCMRGPGCVVHNSC